MANKILDILEIDGVALDIHNPTQNEIGKNVAISATNTWTKGAEITLPGKGVYLIQGNAEFPNAPSTGAVARGLKVTVNSNEIIGYIHIDGTNTGEPKSILGAVRVRTTDAKAAVEIVSNKTASSVATYIKAIRIIDVGGVIRHLKSVVISMFNRPLNIGKEVA